MSSYISTSHFVSAFAARSSILRMRHSHQQRLQWTHKLFRKRPAGYGPENTTDNQDTQQGPDVVVRQVRQTTWPEVTRLLSTGLAGYWSMAVFLIVGFSACHITGPSVVMSVVITAISSVLTGKIHKIHITLHAKNRPWPHKSGPLGKSQTRKLKGILLGHHNVWYNTSFNVSYNH